MGDHRDPLLRPPYEPPGCGLAVLVVVGSLALLLLVAAIARAAPVPAARPVPPIAAADLVGEWQLDWAGTTYSVEMRADGAWTSTAGEVVWCVSWATKGGTLYVHETTAGRDWLVWSARLTRDVKKRAKGKVTWHRVGETSPGPDVVLCRK
jgi:hypothetical protein